MPFYYLHLYSGEYYASGRRRPDSGAAFLGWLVRSRGSVRPGVANKVKWPAWLVVVAGEKPPVKLLKVNGSPLESIINHNPAPRFRRQLKDI